MGSINSIHSTPNQPNPLNASNEKREISLNNRVGSIGNAILFKGTGLQNFFGETEPKDKTTTKILFSTINDNKPLLQRPSLLGSIREIMSSIKNYIFGTGEFKSSWEARRDAVFDIFKAQDDSNKSILTNSPEYSSYLIEDIKTNLENASYCYSSESKEKYFNKASEAINLLKQQNSIDECKLWEGINAIISFIKESKDGNLKDLAGTTLLKLLEKATYKDINDIINDLNVDPDIKTYFNTARKTMIDKAMTNLNAGVLQYDPNLKSAADLPKIESKVSLFPLQEQKGLFKTSYQIDLTKKDWETPSADLLEKGIDLNLTTLARDAARNGKYIIGEKMIERTSIKTSLNQGGTRNIQNDQINRQLVERLEKARLDPRCQVRNNGPIGNLELALASLKNKTISEALVMALFICDFVDALDDLVSENLGESGTTDEKNKKFYQISAQMHQGLFGSSRIEMNQSGFDLIQENSEIRPYKVSKEGIVTCSMECPVKSNYISKKVELDNTKDALETDILLADGMLSPQEQISKKSFTDVLDYQLDIASIGIYEVTVSLDLTTGKSSTTFKFVEENPMCNVFDQNTIQDLKQQAMLDLAQKKRPQVVEDLKRGDTTTIDILLQSNHNKIGDQHVASYLLKDIVEEIGNKGGSATNDDLEISKKAREIKEQNFRQP